MDVEPAHISQIRMAADGKIIEISADASTVAADLKKIDRSLSVRFAENGNPPFWAVYHTAENGRDTSLVLTQQAFQNSSGVWEGLDQRIVRRVMQIGHSTYDYAAELAKQDADADAAKHRKFRESIEPHAERAVHAVRKDLGLKSRIFIP